MADFAFWVLLMTIQPGGIEYTYLQGFASYNTCNALVEKMRASTAIDWDVSGVDCTNVPPPEEGPHFFKPH